MSGNDINPFCSNVTFLYPLKTFYTHRKPYLCHTGLKWVKEFVFDQVLGRQRVPP